jgi:hypothetical protein
MDKPVNHEHNNPVFYKRDLVFTKLAVDKWVFAFPPLSSNFNSNVF